MNSMREWLFDNQWLAYFLTLLVMAATIVGLALKDRRASIRAYLEHRRELQTRRGEEMGRKQQRERQTHVKGLVGDAITDALEELWLAGKATRDEINEYYRAFGNTHNMPDLLPKQTAEQVKAAIKLRRAHGIPSPKQEHPAWGDNPPPVTKNVINASKRFGEKALSRLKKAS